MTSHPLLDKLEKLEKEAEMGEWLAKTRFIYESLNNHKKLIKAIRVLEEVLEFTDRAIHNADKLERFTASLFEARIKIKSAQLDVKELLG